MLTVLKSVKHGWLQLTEKGSRFRMILAGILLAFAFVTPMMFGIYFPASLRTQIEGLPELINKISGYNIVFTEEAVDRILTMAAYDLTVVLGVIVTLPAYACFFTYSWQTYSKTRYGYVDRERPKKGSYSYFRSLASGALLLLRPMICFIILQMGYFFARVISENLVYDGLALPMIFPLALFWGIGLFLSILFMWVTNWAFFAPYYFARGIGVFKAFKLSRELSKRHPFMCDGFSLIFGIAAALSLVSVGVLFILLVLPLMTFTYFSLAEHLDGKKLLED